MHHLDKNFHSEKSDQASLIVSIHGHEMYHFGFKKNLMNKIKLITTNKK